VQKCPSLVAVVCLAVAASASAAEKRLTPQLKASPRPGSVVTQSTKPQDYIPRVQTFDGGTLTKERARDLAKTAGFNLLDFFPCAYSTDRCAMFQVRGKRGNVFLYQVSSERCMTVDSQQTNPNGVGAGAQQAPRRRTRQGGLSASSSSSAGATGAAEETRREASYCFAGYRADYRAREANTVYADNTGYTMRVQHHYQLIQDGRWKDVVTATTSSWSLLKEAGRGTTNRGWAYELEAGGTVLTSDSGSVDLIASEGGNGVELTERCKSKSDLVLATQNAVNQGFYLACKVATLAIPDSVTGNVSLEPLGVGASIEATKNLDLCTNGKDSTAALSELAAKWAYDDCINHPGKYFPADYPNPGALDIKVLPGFESPYAVLLEGGKAPQNCPSSYVTQETVDMGGGTTCQANVRYTCETTVGGACECKDPKVEGDIACVTISGGGR
jgi:hypothetical protein